MEHVAWGIMGSTAWADSMFGPAIQGASNARLHAVLSSNQVNADAFCQKHCVEKGYSNLEAFLADDEVEAIWIATPQNLHAKQTIAALEHGKHVLCEKTMAVTAAECESMILAAERTGKLLSVGYHMRHHPLHEELQQEWSRGTVRSSYFRTGTNLLPIRGGAHDLAGEKGDKRRLGNK